ncbi:uncharacterized protein [Diadema antillarum]|uniref:uncharacterized protein isoform X2 n=1 Tax=Diadema antillarum TaxID=105358 RepID=UPI003A885670
MDNSGNTMAVSRTSLVIIIFALQVVYAASQYAIESDPGQDVTLRCALEAAGEVVVQFWQYANSEDPLQMCRDQRFETLTTEWPAYGVIEFGASVTPEFKSRLLLDVNFDLTLVNVSQGDSGCYQCGLTVDSLKFLDNVTILIVANNSDSGGITEDPASIAYQTILYISLGIALFTVSSIVLVVIVIRKRDRLAAVKRNVRANPDGNDEEMQASVPCLAGVEEGIHESCTDLEIQNRRVI